MAFLNMYRRLSLPSVVESQSSKIFLIMDLVVGPELGLLPSPTNTELQNSNKGKKKP